MIGFAQDPKPQVSALLIGKAKQQVETKTASFM
jgi:hypothetical protein